MTDEETPLIAPLGRAPKAAESTGKRSWKYVAVVAVIGAIGFLAVSLSGYGSASASSEKRIQMAKEGTMTYSSLSDDEKEDLFEYYKKSFGKEYVSTDEEEQRFQHFKNFLTVVDERNSQERAAGGSAIHGMTIFSDLSADEFKTKLLGYKAPSSGASSTGTEAKIQPYTGSTTSVNWAGVYTTPVKNQGYCGSCWAFSTASQIESDAIRAGILTTSDSLSAQQIVSCDTSSNSAGKNSNYGCDGGNTETAYDWVASNGGLETTTDYPYSSFWDVTGTCDQDTSSNVVTVEKYYTITGESNMESYVLSTGPLSVCLAASSWGSYTSGILSTCDTSVDHCVQVVGVNLDEGYWIVRNSWGTDWGIDGYIYLKTGVDLCAITTDPTYVTVSAVSR